VSCCILCSLAIDGLYLSNFHVSMDKLMLTLYDCAGINAVFLYLHMGAHTVIIICSPCPFQYRFPANTRS